MKLLDARESTPRRVAGILSGGLEIVKARLSELQPIIAYRARRPHHDRSTNADRLTADGTD